MNDKQILVAGIGNIFFGDDAFGCQVVQKLQAENLPPDIKIIDFGIKTRDLAFRLCSNYRLVILVDAVRRNKQPGTLYLIELTAADSERKNVFGGHDLKLAETIHFACQLGAKINKILLVGCEPEEFDGDNLSQTVAFATVQAVKLIKKIIADQINDEF